MAPKRGRKLPFQKKRVDSFMKRLEHALKQDLATSREELLSSNTFWKITATAAHVAKYSTAKKPVFQSKAFHNTMLSLCKKRSTKAYKLIDEKFKKAENEPKTAKNTVPEELVEQKHSVGKFLNPADSIGFVNPDNLCWFISAIQTLTSLEGIVNTLMDQFVPARLTVATRDLLEERANGPSPVLDLAFQELVSCFAEVAGGHWQDTTLQQDTSEFLDRFLSILSVESKELNMPRSVMEELVERSGAVCENCYSLLSEQRGIVQHVSLVENQTRSMKEILRELAAFACLECNAPQHPPNVLAPNVLFVAINRHSVNDQERMRNAKLAVDIMTHSKATARDEARLSGDGGLYRLCSVILHHSATNAQSEGHYRCICWRPVQNSWCLYNDNNPVVELTDSQVVKEAEEQGYMFAFERERS